MLNLHTIMMYQPPYLILLQLLLFTLFSASPSQSVTEPNHDSLFCESWRFAVETNNAVNWSAIPDRCYGCLKDYMVSDRYVLDNKLVEQNALEFAKTVNITGDRKDGWIFDVDDTLLSHLPYYKVHGFGAKAQNNGAFRTWVLRAKAPALRASMSLYKEIQQLGFTIFIMTGRPEPYRNITEENLLYAGYTNWKRLIMRGDSDISRLAIVYKSGRRRQLEDEGYIIHGNTGDQWSDLMGYPIAQRSFKVANPTYYVP